MACLMLVQQKQFLIDPAGEATNIFNGQVVIVGADGYLAISTATGEDITTNNLGGSGVGAVGVFVGCQFVNAQGQVINSQYYPSGTTGVVKAFVVTDPNVTFSKLNWMVLVLRQFWALTHSSLLCRAPLLVLPVLVTLRQLWMPQSKRLLPPSALLVLPLPAGDAYTDVLVKFNPSAHSYLNNVGL
jgi:hypothetical protein